MAYFNGSRRSVGIGVVTLAVAVAGFLAIRPPEPRPAWAQCTPNAPRACTTLSGVALGELGSTVSASESPSRPCPDGCREPADLARAELDLHVPEHRSVARIDGYEYDRFVLCGYDVCALSGSLVIFVFELVDDTAVPVIISCPGVMACRVIDRYGWT